MASVYDDEEVADAGILQERRQSNGELCAWVGDGGDGPCMTLKAVLLLEHSLESDEMLIGGLAILPVQEENRDVGIRRALGLTLDEHGGILKMTSEGFEIMPLRGGLFLPGVMGLGWKAPGWLWCVSSLRLELRWRRRLALLLWVDTKRQASAIARAAAEAIRQHQDAK